MPKGDQAMEGSVLPLTYGIWRSQLLYQNVLTRSCIPKEKKIYQTVNKTTVKSMMGSQVFVKCNMKMGALRYISVNRKKHRKRITWIRKEGSSLWNIAKNIQNKRGEKRNNAHGTQEESPSHEN